MNGKVEEINLDLFPATAKPEFTGKRPLVYSRWHRTLKSGTYCTNVDWIEFRNGKISAVIEEKSMTGKISEWQKRIMLDIAEGLTLLYKKRNPKFTGEVPAYVTYHNLESIPNHKEGWVFERVDLRNGQSQKMKESHYKKFIEDMQ